MSWLNIFKKKNKDMISEDQLINYQQNFAGQKFQWIKTNDPKLIGKVVKVRDIQPRGNGAVAMFDDGSQVDVRDINNKLMMLHGDMPPLSPQEVQSIYSPKQPMGTPEVTLPNGEKVAAREPGTTNPEPAKSEVKNSPAPEPIINPFAMFNSDETEITLKLNIKMPEKKLLKMMYNNAEDKEVFLDQLAKYVGSMINNKVVYDSMHSMLEPKLVVKKQSAPTNEVTLTEINEEK